MSLATAGIHCTISQRLSGATEDCSIVRGRQLPTLSPKVLYVRVTTHVWLAVERSRCSRASATRRQSSARYCGEMPDSDWCTSVAPLKSMRSRTGSQCSCRSTGDIWSERGQCTTDAVSQHVTNTEISTRTGLPPVIIIIVIIIIKEFQFT